MANAMLKTLERITCTVLLSVCCVIANGQFEPWTSKADAKDVPRTYIQEITTAPFSYNVRQGGTVDGKMCTSLPGVWETFEQAWESNRSLRMENVGTSEVINPWLRIGTIDYFSQQTIAESVTKGLTSDREKALAIYYFYITHRYHKENGDNAAQGDASQLLNVFGFNTCGSATLCMADLLDKVGVTDCIFSHFSGHVAPQVRFDGRYNTLDGDQAAMMLLRDNHTIANELDLVRDHDLINRVHQNGIMRPMETENNEDYAPYYAWEGNTTQKRVGWAWSTMAMVLRPHEAIEWRWGHGARAKYHGDMSGYPPTSPDTIYNGLWEYTPDLHNDSQWRAGATATNITTNSEGVLKAGEGGNGVIVWHMKSPYEFVGGALSADGERYSFEIGFPNPKDGRPEFTPMATLSDFDGKFGALRTGGNEYWIRCTLAGGASLRSIRISNDIQMAPLTMPSMAVGNNAFTYQEHTDSKTGDNSSRRLRITHTWVERSTARPPGAASSPVYPTNGGKSDGTDVVFLWKAATDPNGSDVTDYHFQLSDRADIRWPLSPNFDKYISRTPDKGSARYTLPRPGLLSHGHAYYWHVQAKNANGLWGPWSSTWSFTAEGPEFPINVALKFVAGRGTLTWSANTAGRAPAKYRIYGSDEKGFTVHDAAYQMKLGDTTELANPFPSNFVAEVTGTSLGIIGVGNSFPNSNRAYYRVVAVDSEGKRSGDSDYVEAPRPFIYSAPVTSATSGKAFHYQVAAIRSIGDLTRRDNGKPQPGTRFWKIEPLKFTLTQKPGWMSIDPNTGLITGTPDGTGGAVVVSVTLTKEHRLVHDANAIMWGNEFEESRTFEKVGPVTQRFVVTCTNGK